MTGRNSKQLKFAVVTNPSARHLYQRSSLYLALDGPAIVQPVEEGAKANVSRRTTLGGKVSYVTMDQTEQTVQSNSTS